jgi:hypothetical protein
MEKIPKNKVKESDENQHEINLYHLKNMSSISRCSMLNKLNHMKIEWQTNRNFSLQMVDTLARLMITE